MILDCRQLYIYKKEEPMSTSQKSVTNFDMLDNFFILLLLYISLIVQQAGDLGKSRQIPDKNILLIKINKAYI